jgi:hypothetical protein
MQGTLVLGTPIDRHNAAPIVLPNTAPLHLEATLMTPELLKYNLELARKMQELRIHGLDDIKYLPERKTSLGFSWLRKRSKSFVFLHHLSLSHCHIQQ